MVTTFPSKSRRDLPGSQLWGRSSHLLTPAACTEAPQEGDRGEGGVSGKRHQLGGIGPCGTNSSQIQPCCINSGGSPKLFPLITMQEFTATGLFCAGACRKGPPWLQVRAKHINRSRSLGWTFLYWGQSRDFSPKSTKSALMYASLKNRKTSLLAKDTYLFLATTKCRIPLLQYLCPQPGHRGCQRRTAAPTCASQQSFTQFDSRCSQTAEGRPSSTSCVYGSTSSRKLIKMQSRALM